MIEDFLPALPEFDADRDIDHRQRAFDWFRHVSLLAVTAMNIDLNSRAVKALPDIQVDVLRGLFNRCARLMLGTMKLTRDGMQGETAAILTRCAIETAVNGRWLIRKRDEGSFEQYLAKGLKDESKFSDLVRSNIADRGESPLEIERRMLDFESRAFKLAGMTRQEIFEVRSLPDFSTRLKDLEFDDLAYASIFRQGSHAVHGSWLDLLDHYLDDDEDDGRLSPRESGVPVNLRIFVVSSLHLLHFVKDYLELVLEGCPERTMFIERVDMVQESIMGVFHDSAGTDFRRVDS